MQLQARQASHLRQGATLGNADQVGLMSPFQRRYMREGRLDVHQ
jgi:hypothetical protein